MLVASHITDGLDEIAEDIWFLDEGRVVAHEDKDELLARWKWVHFKDGALPKAIEDGLVRVKRQPFGSSGLTGDFPTCATRWPARSRAATSGSTTPASKTFCCRSSRGREMDPILRRSSFFYVTSLDQYLGVMGRYMLTRDWPVFEIIPLFMPVWLLGAMLASESDERYAFLRTLPVPDRSVARTKFTLILSSAACSGLLMIGGGAHAGWTKASPSRRRSSI